MNLDPAKRLALRALSRMGDQPMPADALRDSIRIIHPQLTAGDADRAVRDLEADGYIAGTHVDLVGILWSLTPKGASKANQL